MGGATPGQQFRFATDIVSTLNASINLTNFPIATGGLTYSGTIVPSGDLLDNEYIITAYVRLIMPDGTYTTNPLRVSEISSTSGTYTTANAVLGRSFDPGTYTAVITEETTLRTISATDTAVVAPRYQANNTTSGGGSWGSDGDIIIGNASSTKEIDLSFSGCLDDAFSVDALEFLTDPFGAPFNIARDAFLCLLEAPRNAIAGNPPVLWVLQIKDAINESTSSTLQIALPIPDLSWRNPDGSASFGDDGSVTTTATVVLYDSTTNTGIADEVADHVPFLRTTAVILMWLSFVFIAIAETKSLTELL